MKLYALLVGINDYASRPLSQCVNDVHKMKSYLEGLNSHFSASVIETLLDEQAGKEAIVERIKSLFSGATDEDVVLMYYSGHGAQEETNGLFPDEQNGLLECLVCYAADEISSRHFLADKEIRYLLHSLPANPHLVTVFDCCHSGDIVRAYHSNHNPRIRARRITGAFEARDFADFVFADDPKVVSVRADPSPEIKLEYKNHIHLAACHSGESSWEDEEGGVFTRYLLSLLETTAGRLTYSDIARWAKISLKKVTQVSQTPSIQVQGKGRMTSYSPWLNLNPKGVTLPQGMVTNNSKLGWIYSRGSLLGVQQKMEVIISPDDGHEFSAQVSSLDLEYAILDIPLTQAQQLDFKKQYPARTAISAYTTLRIFINDIDDESVITVKIKNLLADAEGMQLADRVNADFFLNIFNGLLYFTLPEHAFQPLAEQIKVHDDTFAENALLEQIKSLVKWHHFYSLDNPDKDFDTCPVRVTVKGPDGTTQDVTNGTCRVPPVTTEHGEAEIFQEMVVEVTNISKSPLYIGVLTLGSDMSITSNPFDGIVVHLNPGESKTMYDHEEGKMYITLDEYKRVYNWKEEWLYYKFIFNNYEDFTNALNDDDFLQPALDPPMTIESLRSAKRDTRGESGVLKQVRKKWGTCRTRIELENSSYNIIDSSLRANADEYASNEMLSPFIQELYFEEYYNGQSIELRLKQNKNQSAAIANRATDNIIVRLLNKIYKTTRRLRFINQRHRSGPVVVAEGDSWFLFPKPGVRDTLDYIMDKFRLLSLAEAGDEIADYLKNKELLEAVQKEKPGYVLISGGGNDILGSEIKTLLKHGIAAGSPVEAFLDLTRFEEKLRFLKEGYILFITEVHRLHPLAIILIHGYDYIRNNPDPLTIKRGWANKYMIDAGITQPEDRGRLITYLVDTFNVMLSDLASSYAHVRYVNNRNTVLPDEWMDEIHPNNTGYRRVANNFLTLMS